MLMVVTAAAKGYLSYSMYDRETDFTMPATLLCLPVATNNLKNVQYTT